MKNPTQKLLIALLCLASVSRLQAGGDNTYYWDTNGSTAGAGAVTTGSWDGVTADWTTDPTGDSATTAAGTQYYSSLYFVAAPDATTSGTGAYTVYVNGNQSADGLYFNAVGNATFTGVNSGQILLGGNLNEGITLPQYAFGTTPNGSVTINVQTKLFGACTFAVGTGETLTMGSNVYTNDGTDLLTKTGLGTLVFSGLTNSGGLQGGLDILQGTVDFTNSSANSGASPTIQVGNTNGTSSLSDAPTFEMGSTGVVVNSTINLNNNGTLIVTGGTFQDNRPSFTVANGASATIENLASTDYIQITHSGSQTLGGNSASTLTFAGPGIFDFENSMTFAGNYVVTGNLKLNNNAALGTNQITVDTGGFLGGSNGGNATANAIILNGGTLGDYDCAIFSGGSITVASPSYVDNESAGGANYGVNIQENVTLNSNLSFVSTGTTGLYNTIAITGAISGTGGLIVDLSTNSLELGASNSFTGVTVVQAGSVNLNHDNNTGSPGNEYALANSTVDLAGGTVYWYASGYLPNYMGGLEGNGTLANTNPNGGGIWGYYIGYNNQSTTFSGVFTSSGNQNLDQTGFGITKVGTGTLTVTGNNTGFQEYFAATAGTLEFGNENSLYGDNTGYWTNSYLSVASGATLALGVGGSGSFTASDIHTLLGNLDSTSSHNAANGGLLAGSAIGFDTTGGNFTQGSTIGPITDSYGSYGGSVGVTKLGSNTLTLDQANTYTGPTTVVAGTLLVTGSLSGGGAVNVQGGTLGGSGKIAGAVTVSSGATLYPGAGGLAATTLTLASTVTFSAGSTFEVNLNNNLDTSDLLAITGGLNIGSGDTLTVNLLNSTPTVGGNIFEIASYTGTLTGTFASVTPGYQVIYTTPDEIEVEAVAVPEPGSWATMLGSFGMLLFAQRLRRGARR